MSRSAVSEQQPTLDGLDGYSPGAAGSVTQIPHRSLKVRDLSIWCRQVSATLARRSGESKRSNSFLFAQAVKLGEEVGELHAEILGLAGQQRRGKRESSKESLAAELADVVICVGIIADASGVDLNQALLTKMRQVDNRSMRTQECS